jgi:hypothetical protein
MTSNTQNWAARRRRELGRDGDDRRRSGPDEALTPGERNRARVKADPFGPSDPRFAYLTRSYE